MGLEEILPDRFGNSNREPTKAERILLSRVFAQVVPAELYPSWVKVAVDEEMSILQIISMALGPEHRRKEREDLIADMFNIKYDGKTDPSIFFVKIQKCLQMHKFEKKVACIFEKIEEMYSAKTRFTPQETDKKQVKTDTMTCNICLGRGHTAKYCFDNPARGVAKPKATRPATTKRPVNKKRTNHISGYQTNLCESSDDTSDTEPQLRLV